MFCPKCGCEYQDGYTICADCNVELVLEQPIIEKKNTYAGIVKRFFSFLIDMLLLIVVIAPILYLFIIKYTIYIPDNVYGYFTIWVISLLIETIPAWLYFAFFESSKHKATLGKMVLKITVVDNKGNKLTFMRATARILVKILSSFFSLVFLIIAVTEKKQGLHDLVTNTLVINCGKEHELQV